MRALLLAVTLLLARSAPALACPVCMGSNGPQVLYTYFATAAVLTLAGLGSVATIGIWLYRRFAEVEGQLSEGDL